MKRRGWAVIATAVLGATLLAGCASEPGGGSASQAPGELELGAAWVDGGRMIALTTWGSSTCVPFAESAELDGSTLAVTLADQQTDGAPPVCTSDNVQRATLVGVPAGTDPAQDLTLAVEYASGSASAVGDVTLAGVAGLAVPAAETDYAPSAGWVGDDGTFAFVTWGSSTCAPEIEGVAETSATEVTVTFAAPPADRVCTMDMAPRVALAVAPGLTGADGAALVLQGDSFDGLRAPILG
ncbi:hypothetical protein [Microbacterium sp. cx-59]|uniref:hypothetical protein n=1 Tax=Microbacterium sp. cx-59 TaxID=2891207 RepID=UPI001E63F6EC|nr:hypothetical protein [Microbacterium sp. cx-59]MCC4908431.1 hypothetical protein [Microbacterium sp. cx-59]